MLRICNRLAEHVERLRGRCGTASQQGVRQIERQLVKARNRIKRFLKANPQSRTEFFLERFLTVNYLAMEAVRCAREERRIRRKVREMLGYDPCEST